ncbi:sensor histidine kinase [Spirosoma koreense]
MFIQTLRGNKLFWKITAVFSGVLLVVGTVFMLIGSRLSNAYYMAAHQELYGNIANHLATFTQPLKNGQPDTTVTHDIIHSIMVANPSVEVYLLDTTGRITDFVVPDKSVHQRQVDIAVVKKWLKAGQDERPLGTNPKQPEELSIFSAAPVYERHQLTGYVYAVLSSERQRQILSALTSNLTYRIGLYVFLGTLLIAFIVGVVTFFLLTDTISQIVAVVKRFKEGDYTARIAGPVTGNLGLLTLTFNDMADVIVANFDKITATDKFRQELIANVSHDLRTPLSIMQGYVETLLLKKQQLTELEKDNYMGIVLDSTKRLSGLVDQFFQYAKLEANQIVPEKEQFLITELTSDILMAYHLKAAERSIDLAMKTKETLSPVFADIALTERVLQNLLDNAFKFTPDGGQITVELEQVKTGVLVKVADTGFGIAPADQPYIFERYKQFHGQQSPKKGMGIGLAIVRKILELHQTVIHVHSVLGQGTCFWFELQTSTRMQSAKTSVS